MMNLKIGDYVIIDSESTSYFKERGIVQSIDIYGYVKVKIDDISIKVKREELRPVFCNNRSPYLNNKEFLAYQDECKNTTIDVKLITKEGLIQQIDLSLDTKDRKWFFELTNKLSKFNEP
jgi:uncharacterized protein YpiB (UPF0302 family)